MLASRKHRAKRLALARVKIAQGMSATQAGVTSGFSDYSSFLKTFRKTYGLTPNEYRKRLFQNPEQTPVENVDMLNMEDLTNITQQS